MVKRQIPRFVVGLFTLLGFLLVLVAIIWIGASHYFEKGRTYLTFFDESVQGLQRDSSVKYRGVDVGRVVDIRVAPDNRLIMVVMRIDMKDDLTKRLAAQLQLAGITGIVFVNLDLQRPEDLTRTPKITFPTEYPVIPSRPSEISRLMQSVDVVVSKFGEIDTRGVLDQVKATAAQIEIFFRGERMENILKKVEATIGNLQSITARVDKLLAEGKVDRVFGEGADALKEVRLVAASLKNEVEELNLRDTVARVNRLLADIKYTGASLNQSLENLDLLLGRLKDRPSDVLFGGSPRPRFNEKVTVQP
ncbi:MAG: MlaD family protein [Syntrophobacterales bacterium]|jgi:phospholipid/cholesterol/gamma-HCH transport system substrate-binding protein|nr:MlaD family protein [Syntrophobacterales bacterium]